MKTVCASKHGATVCCSHASWAAFYRRHKPWCFYGIFTEDVPRTVWNRVCAEDWARFCTLSISMELSSPQLLSAHNFCTSPSISQATWLNSCIDDLLLVSFVFSGQRAAWLWLPQLLLSFLCFQSWGTAWSLIVAEQEGDAAGLSRTWLSAGLITFLFPVFCQKYKAIKAASS